jgi:hypothetical protein
MKHSAAFFVPAHGGNGAPCFATCRTAKPMGSRCKTPDMPPSRRDAPNRRVHYWRDDEALQRYQKIEIGLHNMECSSRNYHSDYSRCHPSMWPAGLKAAVWRAEGRATVKTEAYG